MKKIFFLAFSTISISFAAFSQEQRKVEAATLPPTQAESEKATIEKVNKEEKTSVDEKMKMEAIEKNNSTVTPVEMNSANSSATVADLKKDLESIDKKIAANSKSTTTSAETKSIRSQELKSERERIVKKIKEMEVPGRN